jgi:hypothetical protein
MSHDIPPSEPTDPAAGFLDRMRKMTETNASALYELYKEVGADSPKFQEGLDELVFEVAFSDEKYAQNAATLKANRLKPEEAEALARQQKDTVDLIRDIVIVEAGLPTEDLATDIQKAQTTVKNRLQGVDMGKTDSDNLLRKIGILQENEHGKVTFTYPEDLFPQSVDEKWNMYVLSVQNHLSVVRKLEGGFGSQDEVMEADKIRRFAHNRITTDLNEILGFGKLPDKEWDFEQTRRLVTKMREAKFVGQETGESIRTSKAMARGLGALGLNVVKTLTNRTDSTTH